MGIKDEAVQQATRMFTGSGIGMYEMSLQRLVWSQVKKGTREAQDSVGRQTAEMQYTASEQRLVKMASSYEMFNELAPALITFFEFLPSSSPRSCFSCSSPVAMASRRRDPM